MSIIYCEKHDRQWDSDKLEECPQCEQEPTVDEVLHNMKQQNAALLVRIQQFDAAIRRIAHNVGAVCGGVDTEGDGPGGHTADEIVRCIDKIRHKEDKS